MKPAIPVCFARWFGGLLMLAAVDARADVNSWINPSGGNWDDASSWSLGVPPDSSQSVMITNSGWKAVAINPSTPVNSPNSMTVGNLTLMGSTNTENTLLLNYFGTTTPLRVLNDFNIETNSHVLMLYSGVNAGNTLNLNGVFDQEGGELIFTNSPTNTMQIEGGQFNLTNGVVTGENMYLGGAAEGFVTQDSGLVSLEWLALGSKPSVPGSTNHGTYVLQSGWLMVNTFELVGQSGFGTLTQNGGTNSATALFVPNGTYSKNAGGLFAGEVHVIGAAEPIFGPPSLMTQAGGTTIITNDLSLEGQGTRHAPQGAIFEMSGGSLSTARIQLTQAGGFSQSNGTVTVANELFIDDNGGNLASGYSLSGGSLSTSDTTVESSWPENSEFDQSGGTQIIADKLWINGTALYRLTGGVLSAPNIVLSGNISAPPQFFVNGAPPFALTNQTITLEGGAVVIEDSSQQFGSLTLVNNSCINLAGASAILRFADSHTNDWVGQLTTPPQLLVYNWNGSTSGGGADRLIFGTSSSALTANQIAQIQFVNPAGLPSGTYSARILSSGEVVPDHSSSTSGPVNSWINPTSGNWDDASSWSLGVLPDSSQSIMITNSGWKAVAINPSTLVNFSNSMTVGSLAIIGATNTQDTLLLNYSGLNTPLKVLNSCLIQSNGMLLNLSSSFEVDGGTLTIDGGAFTEDGGFTIAKVPVNVNNGGVLNATNAALTLGSVTLGSAGAGGSLNQDGGSLLAQQLILENGTYTMPAGTLYAIGGTQLRPNGTFNQLGGTNYGDVTMLGGHYDLTSGMVQGNLFSVVGGVTQPGNFLMNGGVLDMKEIDWADIDGSYLSGYLRHGTVRCGSFNITGTSYVYVEVADVFVTSNVDLSVGATLETGFGHLHASTLTIHDGSTFWQGGGIIPPPETNIISSGVIMDGGQFILNGATLETAYIGVGLNARIAQEGGRNLVKGVLSVTGKYEAVGGDLMTDGLYLRGSMLLWGPAIGHVTFTNTGLLDLGGSLGTGVTNAWGGQVQLSTNATINFIGTPAQINFAASSGVSWTPGGLLVISNWNNGNTRLFFGSDSSGLSASQLAQIQFSNPTGFASGNYSAKILNTGEVVPDQATSTSGPVNSWITPGSDNWDDASSWSLGVLPNSSQSVLITNSVSKVVAINSSTPINFPGSMTVSNLTIRGATNTENTLLLNSFGTAVPLTVLNGITLQDGAQILNFNSGLVVQGGTFMITNSDMIQDGGFVRATNGPMYLSGSEYDLTNGVFEGGTVALGYPVSAHFNQYGGTVRIASLGMASYVAGTNLNGYSLYGGTLELPGGMFLLGQSGGLSYFQAGGTNHTTQVTLEPNYGGWVGGFTLNGGLLADSGVELMPGYETPIAIEQNGGSHVITNTLLLVGGATHAISDPTVYHLNGGALSAGTIELDADGGDTFFVQSNATTTAGTVYAHSVGYFSSFNTTITLAGGTLSCSNYTTVDGGGRLNQSGGALVVSNLLDFGGSREPGGTLYPPIYGTYNFTSGTLTASNINISGILRIGNGTTNRISNPGFFELSHLLQISNAVEQLGRFILAGTNATIDLAGSASQLSFANSSGETWAGGATLVVADWNGNASGGGAEQLKFGTDQTGLTPAQLNQIQFRIGTNSYSAKILSTGEVVPEQVSQPYVVYSQQGNNLVLSWPAGWTLQTATNAVGPYSDLPSATSPYTNDMTASPQRFFRLSQ
jgi:hypothetical protein